MANITKAEIVSELLKTEKWKDYKQSTLMAKTKDVLLKLLEESKGTSITTTNQNKIIETSISEEPKKKTSKKSTAVVDTTEKITSISNISSDYIPLSKRNLQSVTKTIKAGSITIKYTVWKDPNFVSPTESDSPKKRGRTPKKK